jgi:hypothetical protein
MKLNFKTCKGHNENCCICCKRLDTNTDVLLVQSLSTDPDDGRKHCIHYISSKSSVSRKK